MTKPLGSRSTEPEEEGKEPHEEQSSSEDDEWVNEMKQSLSAAPGTDSSSSADEATKIEELKLEELELRLQLAQRRARLKKKRARAREKQREGGGVGRRSSTRRSSKRAARDKGQPEAKRTARRKDKPSAGSSTDSDGAALAMDMTKKKEFKIELTTTLHHAQLTVHGVTEKFISALRVQMAMYFMTSCGDIPGCAAISRCRRVRPCLERRRSPSRRHRFRLETQRVRRWRCTRI